MDNDTNCEEQAAVIPIRPLVLVMEITDTVGLQVTYEYDNLVFVSHNVFIYRFTDTSGKVDIFFNVDCETQAEQKLFEKLSTAAKDKGITLLNCGHYKLSQADDENMSIEFLEEC